MKTGQMITNQIKYFFLFCLQLILSYPSIFAQEVIIIEKTRQVEISLEEEELSILEHNQSTKLFQEQLNQYGRETVYYSSLEPLITFDAYTKNRTKKGKSDKVELL